MLLYADDFVLFCQDVDELQSILKIYDETFTRFGLNIPIDKTQTIYMKNNEQKVLNISGVRQLRMSDDLNILAMSHQMKHSIHKPL